MAHIGGRWYRSRKILCGHVKLHCNGPRGSVKSKRQAIISKIERHQNGIGHPVLSTFANTYTAIFPNIAFHDSISSHILDKRIACRIPFLWPPSHPNTWLSSWRTRYGRGCTSWPPRWLWPCSSPIRYRCTRSTCTTHATVALRRNLRVHKPLQIRVDGLCRSWTSGCRRGTCSCSTAPRRSAASRLWYWRCCACYTSWTRSWSITNRRREPLWQWTCSSVTPSKQVTLLQHYDDTKAVFNRSQHAVTAVRTIVRCAGHAGHATHTPAHARARWAIRVRPYPNMGFRWVPPKWWTRLSCGSVWVLVSRRGTTSVSRTEIRTWRSSATVSSKRCVRIMEGHVVITDCWTF